MGIFTDIRDRLVALSGFVQEPAPQGPSAKWIRHKNGARFESGSRADYSTDQSVRKATPERLGDALRNADEGDTYQQYEIFEEVERDPLVGRTYNKRRQAILSKDIQITPASEDDPRAVQASDMANEMIFGVDGHGGIDNIMEGMFDLTDAVGKAFAVCQIIWRLDAGRFAPVELVRWPQQNFQLGDPTQTYDGKVDQVRIITDEHRTEGIPLEDFPVGTWICHKQKNWSQPLARAALFRSITWYWLFKRFGMSDWTIFLERYGVPPRMGKYGPGAQEQDRLELWDAVLNLGKDHACIYPDNSTIELLETKGLAAGAPHPQLLGYLNDQITIAISGNTMSVTQGDKGARSAKEAYQTDEGEQTEYDCKALAKTVRDQLVKPLIYSNLGTNWPVPKVGFLFEDEEDLDKRSQVDERLKRMGKTIPVSYVVETYGVPEPDGDEEVLGSSESQEPPAAPGQPPDDDEPPQPNMALIEEAARRALRESGLPEKKSSVDWVISMMLSEGP